MTYIPIHTCTVADSGVEDDHLDVAEFLQYAKVDRRLFGLGNLMFALFAGKDMKLDFYEFIKSMFFFLSQSRTELAMFLFQLFDPDDSDSLTGEELRTLAKCVNPGYNHRGVKRRYRRKTMNERLDKGYDYHYHYSNYHYHYRHYNYDSRCHDDYRYHSQTIFI